MNLQKINNENDFEKSFLLVDDFYEAKENAMKDLGLKTKTGDNIIIPNVEKNVLKMRIGIRTKEYFTDPELPRSVDTIDRLEMNKEVTSIIKIANQQRKKDVIDVIRYNDFSYGYSTAGRLSLFSNKEKENEENDDLDYQVKVLLKAMDDKVERDYLKKEFEKLETEYDKETFLDCILSKYVE